MIRIVAADDHPAVLDALAKELSKQKDMQLVATADHASKLLGLVSEYHPDIAILGMGISADGFDPVATVGEIKKQYPDVQILFLADDDVVPARVHDLSRRIDDTIQTLGVGGGISSDPIARKSSHRNKNPMGFTEQEKLVFQLLLLDGLSVVAIARVLEIPEKSIHDLLGRIIDNAKIKETPRIRLRPKKKPAKTVTVPDQTPYASYAHQVTANMLSADILARFPQCQAWLNAHIADLRDWQIALPLVACRAVGGSLEDGLAVASAWCPFCLAAVILDHVEDGEFTPDKFAHSEGQAANLGTALVFLCFHSLAAIKDASSAARAGALFSEQGFSATSGQGRSLVAALPMPLSVDDALQAYWQEIILKSGCIYRAAAAGGAAAGGGDESAIARLGDYGTALGVIAQLLDDGSDLLKTSDDDVIQSWQVSLPLLLYLLATRERQVVFPPVHTRAEWQARLREARVVEIFSKILLQWQARALESIQGLSLSHEEKKILETFPVLILEPVLWEGAE